ARRARRRRAARYRDGRDARADRLAVGDRGVPAAPPDAAARAGRLLPRARHPLLHGHLRSGVRRRRTAHLPRGRPAALAAAMSLATLLSGPLPPRVAAVAGAVGAVAITVLYLIRLRRRRMVVPFAPLWLAAAGPRPTTS